MKKQQYTRDFLESRKPFCPDYGEFYQALNGQVFECVDPAPKISGTILQNVKTGWRFVAKGVGIYENGKIDWDYSQSGHYVTKGVEIR